MHRCHQERLFGFQPTRHGRSNSTDVFVNVSADGTTVYVSYPGSNNYGDASLLDGVVSSRKLIGNYCQDSKRNFVNDKSYLHFLQLKYLPDGESMEKIVDLDLNIPRTAYKLYASTGNKDLENFLSWISNNKEAFDKEFRHTSISKDGGKFVMNKNILTNLLVIPYRLTNEFKFYAYSFDGVVYFQKEYKNIPNNQTSVYGHKFEQFMTEEDTSKDVICNEGFRAVVSSNLGPHKLLFSAALDCASPEDFDFDFRDLSSFITVKTLRLQREDSIDYKHQMLMWYLNYVFLGVPKTLIGQRDKYGSVKLLKLYEAKNLPFLAKNSWNPMNCMFFASEMFSFIKNKVESEPGSVFCITKESRNFITCVKDPEAENFLPEWFMKEVIETKVSGHGNDVEKDVKSVLEMPGN